MVSSYIDDYIGFEDYNPYLTSIDGTWTFTQQPMHLTSSVTYTAEHSYHGFRDIIDHRLEEVKNDEIIKLARAAHDNVSEFRNCVDIFDAAKVLWEHQWNLDTIVMSHDMYAMRRNEEATSIYGDIFRDFNVITVKNSSNIFPKNTLGFAYDSHAIRQHVVRSNTGLEDYYRIETNLIDTDAVVHLIKSTRTKVGNMYW